MTAYGSTPGGWRPAAAGLRSARPAARLLVAAAAAALFCAAALFTGGGLEAPVASLKSAPGTPGPLLVAAPPESPAVAKKRRQIEYYEAGISRAKNPEAAARVLDRIKGELSTILSEEEFGLPHSDPMSAQLAAPNMPPPAVEGHDQKGAAEEPPAASAAVEEKKEKDTQEVAMPGVAKHSVTETMLASGPGCMKLSLDDVPIDRAKGLGLGNKLGRRTLMRAAEAQARGFSVVYEFPAGAEGHLFADGDRYHADDMETKTGQINRLNYLRLMNALVRSPETAKIAKTAENSQQSFAIGLMAGLSEKQITEEIRKTSVTVEGLLGLVSAEAGKNTCYDTFR